MQLTMFIDKDKCIGCYSCIVACKLEHHLPPYPIHPPMANPEGPELIRVYKVGPQIHGDKIHQYFQPIACMHCINAPCIDACPYDALYKDIETGIVLVNEDECVGCKFCLWACPFGSPQFYDGKVYLCDLCIHRMGEERQNGRQTACEAACPARAIYVGTTDEISALIGQNAAERIGKDSWKERKL